MFRVPQGEAPPAPRQLTPDARRDAAVQGRFLRLFGGIWAMVGGGLCLFFTIIQLASSGPLIGTAMGGVFGLFGALLYFLGRAKERVALHVFRDGVETTGTVTKVFQDFRMRVNKQNPWRVLYEFTGPDGRPTTGTATFWGERPNATQNDRVVLLYDPNVPSRSVLWTRLDDERELQVRAEPVRVATPAREDAVLDQAEIEAGEAEQPVSQATRRA